MRKILKWMLILATVATIAFVAYMFRAELATLFSGIGEAFKKIGAEEFKPCNK